MRQPFDLKAGQSRDRGCGGHFIVGDQITGYVTVTTNTGRVYQLEQGQVVYPDGGYQSITVESADDQYVILLCGYGRFDQVAESVTAIVSDQLVVKQIIETVVAEIVGTVAVTQAGAWAADVSDSDVNVVNQVNIRTLTETIKTAAQGITETRETAASSLAEASHTFTAAAEIYNVPANANRRDLAIVADQANTGRVTVGGIPLERGESFALDNYIGAVVATAETANDKIWITEVIK